MFVHLFSVLVHNRSISYCLALTQSLITASTLDQRLLLANSWQDVSAQKKTVFFKGQNIPPPYQAIFNHSLPICNLIEFPCS